MNAFFAVARRSRVVAPEALMATENPFLKLLEKGEGTLDEAVEAIDAFERELMDGSVELATCSSCGRPYVVTQDKWVVNGPGRRSVCWRRACRQGLRARGLCWTGHQHLSPPRDVKVFVHPRRAHKILLGRRVERDG